MEDIKQETVYYYIKESVNARVHYDIELRI